MDVSTNRAERISKPPLSSALNRESEHSVFDRILYPRTSPNGVYIVEDLHTAYWDEFGGGLKREGTFVELCKSLIDELNAYHTREQVRVSEFTKLTLSMHSYDCMAVFERGRHLQSSSLRTGMTFKKFWKNTLPKL